MSQSQFSTSLVNGIIKVHAKPKTTLARPTVTFASTTSDSLGGVAAIKGSPEASTPSTVKKKRKRTSSDEISSSVKKPKHRATSTAKGLSLADMSENNLAFTCTCLYPSQGAKWRLYPVSTLNLKGGLDIPG